MISLSFILVNFYLFIKKKKLLELFTLYIFFSIFVQVGYAIKIGSLVIVMNDIILLYLFIYTILKIVKNQKIKKINIYIYIIFGVVFLGYLNIYSVTAFNIFPINGDFDKQFINKNQFREINFSIQNILRLLIFFMFLVVFTNNNIFKYKKRLEERILFMGIFQIVYTLFEYFSKVFGIYPVIINKLLLILGSYGDYQVRRIIIREGKLWLQGLTLESGYLGFVFFIILLTLDKFYGKKYRFLEAIVICLCILNRSLTSFILLCFYFIFKLLKQQISKKQIIITIIILLLLFTFIINYDLSKYFDRIQNIFNADKSIRSENIRRNNIINSIKLVLEYPLLGYGLGNTKALSGIISFILNIGILGTLLWFNLINKIFKNNYFINKIFVIVIFLILGGIENLYNLYIPIIIFLLVNNSKKRCLIEKEN